MSQNMAVGSVAAIEVKASATVAASDFAALKTLRDQLGQQFRAGGVLLGKVTDMKDLLLLILRRLAGVATLLGSRGTRAGCNINENNNRFSFTCVALKLSSNIKIYERHRRQSRKPP